jgi:glucosylceramidase
MKTNNRMKDGAELRGDFLGQYYKTYAGYFRRFFEVYAEKGIQFWGLTIQNEPRKGQWYWQTMHLTPDMQRQGNQIHIIKFI